MTSLVLVPLEPTPEKALMSDDGDLWRALRAHRKEQRAALGESCPGCPKVQPKRIPTILMPGQRCRVCGHRRPTKSQSQ